MACRARFLMTAALVAGLALAPAAHAQHWRGGGWGHGGYHHNGNAAGAAIIGGLVGLGLGAAIASSGGGYYGAPGYYAPPYAYYGQPNPYYAAPPPVYYGY